MAYSADRGPALRAEHVALANGWPFPAKEGVRKLTLPRSHDQAVDAYYADGVEGNAPWYARWNAYEEDLDVNKDDPATLYRKCAQLVLQMQSLDGDDRLKSVYRLRRYLRLLHAHRVFARFDSYP